MNVLKTDMTILISRVNLVNELNMELNSLKSKQRAMEAAVRIQEEFICNLNDGNMFEFFKAKLMSFVNRARVVTYNDHGNNTENPSDTINTKHGLCNNHSDSNTNASETGLNNRRTNAKNTIKPQVVCIADDSIIISNPINQDDTAIAMLLVLIMLILHLYRMILLRE